MTTLRIVRAKNIYGSKNLEINNTCLTEGLLYANSSLYGQNNLDVTGNCSINGNLNVSGSSVLNSDLIVDSLTNINGTATINKQLNITTSLTIDSNLSISSDLIVNGPFTMTNDNIGVNGNKLDISGNVSVKDLNVRDNTVIDSNLNVSGSSTFNDTLNITGNTTIDGTLTVAKKTSIIGQTNFLKNTIFNDNVTVGGNATLGGNLTVSGNNFIGGNLIIASDLTIGSDLNIVSGVLNIGNNLTINGEFTTNGVNQISNNLNVNYFKSSDCNFNSTLNVSGLTNINGIVTLNSTDPTHNLQIDNDLNVSGAVVLNNNLNVSGNLNLNNNLQLNTANLNDVIVKDFEDSNSNFSSSLLVSGGITIDNTLQVNSNLNVTGDLNITGNTNIAGKVEIKENMTINGNFKIGNDMIFDSNLLVKGAMITENSKEVFFGDQKLILDGTNTQTPYTGFCVINKSSFHNIGLTSISSNNIVFTYLDNNPFDINSYNSLNLPIIHLNTTEDYQGNSFNGLYIVNNIQNTGNNEITVTIVTSVDELTLFSDEEKEICKNIFRFNVLDNYSGSEISNSIISFVTIHILKLNNGNIESKQIENAVNIQGYWEDLYVSSPQGTYETIIADDGVQQYSVAKKYTNVITSFTSGKTVGLPLYNNGYDNGSTIRIINTTDEEIQVGVNGTKIDDSTEPLFLKRKSHITLTNIINNNVNEWFII